MNQIKFILLFAALLTSKSFANVLGNMQTFAPTPDSLYFETVHSSDTLKAGQFNLGAYVSYLRNSLTVYDNTLKYVDYKDASTNYDVFVTWGASDRLEIFYAQPGVMSQKADDGQIMNNAVTKGTHVHRVGLKYDMSNSESGGWAVVGSVDSPMTIDDPYTGSPSAPMYNLEFARDWRQSDTAYGFNIGYRKRNPGEVPPANPWYIPLKDQVTASFAAAFGLKDKVHYHLELIGAAPVDKGDHPSATHASSLEALLGLRFRLVPDLWAHVGATVEALSEGFSPQYRAYAGLNWTFGFAKPKESKATETKPLPTSALLVSPASVQMLEGGEQVFFIESGRHPVEGTLSNDFGTWDQAGMRYRAPLRSGETTLFMKDADGNTQSILIIVNSIPKADRELTLSHLEFVFNTSNLTPSAGQNLSKNVRSLSDLQIERIIVIGHTDSVGQPDYNQQLSLNRAQAVKDAMIQELGLETSRIETIGMGQERPIASNDTAEGRQSNRRVELKVYYKK